MQIVEVIRSRNKVDDLENDFVSSTGTHLLFFPGRLAVCERRSSFADAPDRQQMFAGHEIFASRHRDALSGTNYGRNGSRIKAF